jgi:hypothetical protein
VADEEGFKVAISYAGSVMARKKIGNTVDFVWLNPPIN